MLNFEEKYLQFVLSKLTLNQEAMGVAKLTEDAMVRRLKQNQEPKKPCPYIATDGGNNVANYWQRSGRRLSEELVKGCYDAKRKNYEIRNLTESELNFLLEYVCNS